MFNTVENKGNYLAENAEASYIATVLKCAIARDIAYCAENTAYVDEHPHVLEKLNEAMKVTQMVIDELKKLDSFVEGENNEQGLVEGDSDGSAISES